jgi:hypothetical protein
MLLPGLGLLLTLVKIVSPMANTIAQEDAYSANDTEPTELRMTIAVHRSSFSEAISLIRVRQ